MQCRRERDRAVPTLKHTPPAQTGVRTLNDTQHVLVSMGWPSSIIWMMRANVGLMTGCGGGPCPTRHVPLG